MHSFTKLLLLLLFTITSCLFLDRIYSKAGDPAFCAANKVCTGRDRKCARGSIMRFVVELNNEIEESRFYGFCVKVDQFSVLNLFGSGRYMNASANSTITLHIGDEEISDERYYMNDDRNAIVSSFTAIVGLSSGKFVRSNSSRTNIVYESTCSRNVCQMDRSAPCIRGRDCGTPMSKISKLAGQNSTLAYALQDVKLYLAWEGTDRNSAALKSASLLPNRFFAYSFSAYYQIISNFVFDNLKNRDYDNEEFDY